MGWLGSANNMKWVGLGVNLMGWVDKYGPMSMSASPSCLATTISHKGTKIVAN